MGTNRKKNYLMRTFAKVLAVSSAAALVLTGCGRSETADSTSSSSSGTGTGSSSMAGGFAADSLIGIALPQKTS